MTEKYRDKGRTEEGETAWYMAERQGQLHFLPSPTPYSRKTGYILAGEGYGTHVK